MARPLRVVVADDEALLRQGLVRLLADHDFEVVGQASTRDDAVAVALRERPDVLLVDVRMPPTHSDEGLQVAFELDALAPEIGILVLSNHIESRYALRLLTHRTRGVGYLLKEHVADVEVVAEAIRRVAGGGAVVDRDVVQELARRRDAGQRLAALSPRERELLELMAEGRSNRGIERSLVLSPKTVETHIRAIFTKLGLPQVDDDHRRVLAVLAYLRARDEEAEP